MFVEKSRYLNQLLNVIRVLRGAEATVVKKHIKAYEVSPKNEPGKMWQLFYEVNSNQINNYEKLKQKISPDSTDDSFNKLIRRTIDRVEESLIVDVNIRRKGAYSDVFRMKFFLRKQIMQGQILIGRGIVSRTKSIFNNIIRYSKKYELYDELIDALYFKQMLVLNTDGDVEVAKLAEKIRYYENCRSLLLSTKQTYLSYESSFLGKSYRGKISNKIKEDIENLYSYYEQTQSANILSYYYLLKVEIFKTERNYQKVAYNTRELISLLQSSVAIFSAQRIAYLQIELSGCEYYLIKFESALNEIEKAFFWLANRGIFFLESCLRKIEILILSKKYEEVLTFVEEVYTLKILDSHSFHKSKLNYQKSIALFGVGNYKSALSLFVEKNEIEKDKEGWNVWIRIMRILCSIEMKRLDLIDYEIESFRKYLQRVGKQYEVRERDQLILKVLMELEKQDFNFKETALQREKELKLLEATDKKTGWNPDSPEMILFHDWFKAKQIKKAYEPNYELYRKAWK